MSGPNKLYTNSNPLPVSVATTITAEITSTILPTGASTEAKQDDIITSLSSIDSKLDGPIPVDVTFPITQAVSGSVSVDNFPATQPISGSVSITGTPSVTVSGVATESTLASIDSKTPDLITVGMVDAVPVAVAGGSMTVDANQLGTWSVGVNNFPSDYATANGQNSILARLPSALVSDRLKVDGSGVTQPVSGTVTATISGSPTVSVSNFPATQPISAVSLPLPTGAASAANQGTANTSLASIDSKLPALVSSRVPVSTPSNVSDNTSVGTTQATLIGGVFNGTTAYRLRCDSLGTLYVNSPGLPSGLGPTGTNGSTSVVQATSHSFAMSGQAPISDATTGVYTRYPAHGNGPTAVTGSASFKSSAGRVRSMMIRYTGTASSVFIQLHNASSTGTIATTTLSMPGFEVGNANRSVVIAFPHDIPCTLGISVAASSTCETYTAAGSETFSITLFGA